MSGDYTYIYELGTAKPVGKIPNYSSGSCYSYSFFEDDTGFIVGNERTESWTWKCHYCGSTADNESLKCPQCAGEKRDQKVDFHRSHADITYVEETITYEVVDKPSAEGAWSRFKRWISG